MDSINILLIPREVNYLRRQSKPFRDKGYIVVVELPVKKLIAAPEVAIGREETDLGGRCPKQICLLEGGPGKAKPPLALLAREDRRRVKYLFLLGTQNSNNRHKEWVCYKTLRKWQ